MTPQSLCSRLLFRYVLEDPPRFLQRLIAISFFRVPKKPIQAADDLLLPFLTLCFRNFPPSSCEFIWLPTLRFDKPSL